MDKSVKELFAVLEVLIANHKELFSCEQKKVECIIRQDWQGLSGALKHSEEVLKSIETAEKLRSRCLETLGYDESASMRSVIGDISKKQAGKLEESTRTLKRVMDELKVINDRVQTLLQSSLEVINFSLSLFQGEGPSSRTYCMNGSEEKGGERCTSLVLDTKA
ncbi:MAG: flagellar protein FlgN [Spirochaetes bacterium]|nr:flagellar protein FlgN [Spirochaetota bacterium]